MQGRPTPNILKPQTFGREKQSKPRNTEHIWTEPKATHSKGNPHFPPFIVRIFRVLHAFVRQTFLTPLFFVRIERRSTFSAFSALLPGAARIAKCRKSDQPAVCPPALGAFTYFYLNLASVFSQESATTVWKPWFTEPWILFWELLDGVAVDGVEEFPPLFVFLLGVFQGV